MRPPHAPFLLLRAPPFPGIAPAVASIDGEPAEAITAEPDAAAAAAQAMVAARVGGCFWGEQVAGRPRLIVLGRGEPLPAGDLGDAALVARGVPARDAARRGAMVVTGTVDPWPLIAAAELVVCPAENEIGLLALAAGKPVTGAAGKPSRCTPTRLAVALLGPRYRDPITGRAIDVLAAIALLAMWRQLIDANRGLAAATGIAFWKRRELRRLLWDGRVAALPFLAPAAALARAGQQGGAVAAWPSRVPPEFAAQAAAAGVPVRWVEDGFLRSVGLGSDLLPPLSVIVDDLTPYFDPAHPSRLEQLLQTASFDALLLARAAALRDAIVARRISKYQAGGDGATAGLAIGGRLVVVIGQVEDDLSVLLGGGPGASNLRLIERARAAEPNAFLVYRPHPDVEAGHRRGAIPDAAVLAYVDRIDRGGSLDALLARADSVHVLTSLTGFEALLRGVRVVVHGAPFYAGWGLTEDCGPALPRRKRRLSLKELVAGALICYPRYLDPVHGLPCTPEMFVEALGSGRGDVGWLVRLRRVQGRWRWRLARGR